MYVLYLQGGAVNRGLFFAGPALTPLGAVSGKISTDGRRSKRWHKCSSGDERTRCRHGNGLPPSQDSQLCMEKNKMKIFEGLSNSQNMVFSVKKLQDDGVDLLLRRRDGKK
jgi:hypothetical protein